MKIVKRSKIRISKLNDDELRTCLEKCESERPIIEHLLWRYDPEKGRMVESSARWQLQRWLDKTSFAENYNDVPKDIKKALKKAIKAKEENQTPFLTYTTPTRVDENGNEKVYSYPTQEDFFKKLNDLYESPSDKFYESPNIEEIEVCNVFVQGNEVECYSTFDLMNYMCDNYRDTETYQWIPGIKEQDISAKDQKLEFPGGFTTTFQEIRDRLDKHYNNISNAHASEMITTPTNEKESDWKIIYDDGYEYDDNKIDKFDTKKGMYILRNNEPVHAFLIGSEPIYTESERNLLKNLAEDYIVRQVYYKEQSPERINMEKYELEGQFLGRDGMRAFTIPALEINREQEWAKKKNQLILNVPEKPTAKDFVDSLKTLVNSYQNKGVSQTQIKEVLGKIVGNARQEQSHR